MPYDALLDGGDLFQIWKHESVKKPLLLKLLNNTDPVPINLRGVVVLMTPSATRAHDGEPMSSRSTSTSAVGVVGARRRELEYSLVHVLIISLLPTSSIRSRRRTSRRCVCRGEDK